MGSFYYPSLPNNSQFELNIQLKHRKTISRRLHLQLSRLIRLTVQSGLICSSGAIVTLILSQIVAVDGRSDYYTPTLSLTKLYSINLLAILNSRIKIVGGREHEEMEADSLEFLTRDVQTTSPPIEIQNPDNWQRFPLLSNPNDDLRRPDAVAQTNFSTMTVCVPL